MRSEKIENEIQGFIPKEEDISDYIPVYDEETIIGVVKASDVDDTSDASYGGAWKGGERLIGFVEFDGLHIVVVNDGDYDYARGDYAVDENEQKRFDNGELIWNSEDCRFEEPEEVSE